MCSVGVSFFEGVTDAAYVQLPKYHSMSCYACITTIYTLEPNVYRHPKRDEVDGHGHYARLYTLLK